MVKVNKLPLCLRQGRSGGTYTFELFLALLFGVSLGSVAEMLARNKENKLVKETNLDLSFSGYSL